MDATTIGVIVTAAFTTVQAIVLAWFQYNQRTKDKMADISISELKDKLEKKKRVRYDNAMLITGALWDVLRDMRADRVYILQPHPLGNGNYEEKKVSVQFEVLDNGVTSMKSNLQDIEISKFPMFSRELVSNSFKYISNIDQQIEDRYAKSILSSYGSHGVIIRRLSDNEHDWVGSIFAEYTKSDMPDEAFCQKIMHNAAINTQFILPEIQD